MRSLVLLSLVTLVACARDPEPKPVLETVTWPSLTAPPQVAWPAESPARAETGITEVAVPDDLSVYVVRGSGAGPIRTVFLTGSCTHPTTNLKAFEHAAAEHGGLVALQGDQPCGDPASGLRKWSSDSAATSARIDAALAAVSGDSTELTLVGYSQGAERAEWLANRFPAKYTRFVLIAGPIVPSARRMSGAHAVATLAGRGDIRENMADGARVLRAASIPAIYMELSSPHHGELDPAADATIAQAFDWLDENEKQPHTHARASRTR